MRCHREDTDKNEENHEQKVLFDVTNHAKSSPGEPIIPPSAEDRMGEESTTVPQEQEKGQSLRDGMGDESTTVPQEHEKDEVVV